MSFEPDFAGALVRPSPNFGGRREWARPDMIVLHYTGMQTGLSAEDWLCDPISEVSSHYLVHEDGGVVQMVREADRAWHAGRSLWRGRTDINSASIGIEIVNPGHAGGSPDYPAAQIDALVGLCADIVRRHEMPRSGIVAHSDIAPARKADPGERFPWTRLAGAGLVEHVEPSGKPGRAIMRPGEGGTSVRRLQGRLAAYGYGVEPTGCLDEQTIAAVRAFQRRFRPDRVDGVPDRSTLYTLAKLLERYPPRWEFRDVLS